MSGRRYSRQEVVRISSRYLSRGDMALVVVASLKRPEAFEVVDGLLEAMLAKAFLEIAQRVNEGELDDRRRREGGA